MYKNGTDVLFLYNNNRNVGSTATFNASTCVFTGTGTTSSTFYNGDRYLQRNTNTLRFNANSTTWTITTYGRVLNSNRYIRYYNNGWTSLNNTNTDPGTDVAYTVLFAYSNHENDLTDPVISGNNVLTSTGNHTYSIAATSTPQYHQFDGYSGTTATTYYWYSSALQTSEPTGTNVTTGTWTLTGNTIGTATYATVNNTNGTINVSSLPPTDLTMTLSCEVTANGITKTATKTVFLYSATIAQPTITCNDNYITLATTSVGATIYYTTDGNNPNSSSTAYTGPFSIENLLYPVTVKAVAIRNGNSSASASQTYTQPQCAKPVISFTGSPTGTATITCATEGATIRYTTDGTTPSSTVGTIYTGPISGITNLTTVKAIAYKDGYENSSVASEEYVISGVNSDGVVILNDREDHNWSYYQPMYDIFDNYPPGCARLTRAT